jgi:hypothetical protein
VISIPVQGLPATAPPSWLDVTLRPQATALKLIDKFGASAVQSRTTGQTFDAITGQRTTGLTVTWSVPVVQQEYDRTEIDGVQVLRDDLKFLLPGVAPQPLPGDTLTTGSGIFRIIAVLTEQPAGIPILYTLQGRK